MLYNLKSLTHFFLFLLSETEGGYCGTNVYLEWLGENL